MCRKLPTNHKRVCRKLPTTHNHQSVIERVIAKQLTVYLQENHLHDQFQSAYRQDHSTETALIKVHSDILCAVDRGCVIVLVMLDLTAAFETIGHAILLSQLFHRFGIMGAALEWFRSHLSGRHEVVRIGNENMIYYTSR